MKVLVTGANGFLGSRASALLAENGHEVVRVSRPRGAERAGAKDAVRIDAGDPAARELIAGCDAVLHFAGIPDPARAREDPARAVRENAGTTLNLLEGCLEHGSGLTAGRGLQLTDPTGEIGVTDLLWEAMTSLIRLGRAPIATIWASPC